MPVLRDHGDEGLHSEEVGQDLRLLQDWSMRGSGGLNRRGRRGKGRSWPLLAGCALLMGATAVLWVLLREGAVQAPGRQQDLPPSSRPRSPFDVPGTEAVPTRVALPSAVRARGLRIRVRGPHGRPVRRALVYTLEREVAGAVPGEATRGRTDASGTCVLRPPATSGARVLVVGARAEGLLPAAREVRFPDVSRLDITLREGLAISGDVVEGRSGQPLAGVRICASNDSVYDREEPFMATSMRPKEDDLIQRPPLHKLLARTRTDTRGHFTLRGLAPGTYSLVLDEEAWIVHPTFRADAGANGVRVIAVHPMLVRVVAFDAKRGGRISGFRASFEVRGRGANGASRRRRLLASSVEDRLAVAWTLPESWPRECIVQATVTAPGYRPARAQGVVQSGTTCVLVVQMQPESTVEMLFDLSWHNGDPVDEEVVAQFMNTPLTRSWSRNLEPRRSGQYALSCPAGRWRLRLYPRSMISPTLAPVVSIDTGRRTRLRVRMPDGATVSLHATPSMVREGWFLQAIGPHHSVQRRFTRPDEVLRALPLGSWKFRAVGPQGRSVERHLLLGGGDFLPVILY